MSADESSPPAHLSDPVLRAERRNGSTIVTFTKRWVRDEQAETIFMELSRLAEETSGKELMVDLGNADYLPSAVLAKFVALTHRLRRAGGDMILCHLSPRLKKILENMRLDSFFTIQQECASGGG